METTMNDLETKYDSLPEDAQLYVDLIAHNPENMRRALRAHALIPPPDANRVPYSIGDESDPEAEMDEYITAFVRTYGELEMLDSLEVTAVN